MDELLLAHELFLLLHDDESGKARSTAASDTGYAAALLLDLHAAGVIDLIGDDVRAIGRPAQQPLLIAAAQAISADKQRTARRWVAVLPGRLRPMSTQIGQSLVDRGVLDEQHARVLGLFASTRWPERDPMPEHALRERLHGVLVTGLQPDARTTALLVLLDALNAVRAMFERHERGDAARRARAITKDAVAADAMLAQVHKGVRTAVVASQSTAVIS